MGFIIKKCKSSSVVVPGLLEVIPEFISDERGYYLETYSEKDFFDAGLTMHFVQDNQSKSKKGVLRGLHFQTRHPQGKLVRSLYGTVYDVAVDLRKDSPTFGKFSSVILESEKQNMFYIPKGFAHGFYVLSDEAVISYKCTDFYDSEGEGGIIWNDKTISVAWPFKTDFVPLLSEKDKNHPFFCMKKDYFDSDGNWIGKD